MLLMIQALTLPSFEVVVAAMCHSFSPGMSYQNYNRLS